MKSILDELFRGDVSGLGTIEKLAILSMAKEALANEKEVPVINVEIGITPIGVTCSIKGNKNLIDRFGLDDEFKQLSEEVKPVMEKYTSIIGRKYKEDFLNFVSGGGRQVTQTLMKEILN